MLLFLVGIGMDIPTILILLSLLVILGLLIFWLSRKIFRKTLRGVYGRKVNMLSRAGAFFLAPILFIGILILIIYISVETPPKESKEEITSHHYEMMEEDIAEDLKIGMSKAEILELFGENDTTLSVMVYDLSLPDAEEKYILELRFDSGRLSGFSRQ